MRSITVTCDFVQVIPYADMVQMFPHEEVKQHLHNFALNPYTPMVRGTGQRPDIFFQNSVAANKYYEACPRIVEEVSTQETGALSNVKSSVHRGANLPQISAFFMASYIKTNISI